MVVQEKKCAESVKMEDHREKLENVSHLSHKEVSALSVPHDSSVRVRERITRLRSDEITL